MDISGNLRISQDIFLGRIPRCRCRAARPCSGGARAAGSPAVHWHVPNHQTWHWRRGKSLETDGSKPGPLVNHYNVNLHSALGSMSLDGTLEPHRFGVQSVIWFDPKDKQRSG